MSAKNNNENNSVGPGGDGTIATNKSAGPIDIFGLAQKQQAERRKADEEAEQRWNAASAKLGGGGEKEGADGEIGGMGGDLAMGGPAESGLIFCGAPNSGKSTLLGRFLLLESGGRTAGGAVDGRNAGEKTVALEYTFMGRPRAGGGRHLVHCWELAGGGSMSNLLEIPFINPRILHSISLLLFLDLTRPESIQSLVDPLLGVCRKRIEALCPGQRNAGRVPSADKRLVRPLGIPFVLVCAKYDEFQNLDSERKRLTYRCIRLLAHLNGAAIITFSNRMDSLVQRARSLLAHLAFGTPPPTRVFSVDPQQPLLVFPHGMDAMEKIDSTSGPTLGSFSEAMFQFLQSLNDAFPQQSAQTEEGAVDEEEEKNGGDGQFAEPAIDNLVEDGMRRLELYGRERRNRMEAEAKAGRNMATTMAAAD